jgi:16S rRNA (cytidine1402-2'-O)-methyltransferase
MATLYIVSTPIGHLDDLTHRAEAVLRTVARVLAEDTRHTKILFRRYGIETPLVSAHQHNEQARVGEVVRWLNAGEDMALVSDAGTPLLSDPGERLVRAVVDAGHVVVPVPGASALLAAYVAAGLPGSSFTFHGFVPRTGSDRSRLLEEVAASPRTSIIYESPNRLPKLLADLESICGGERLAAVGRELTKLHETFFRGTLSDAILYYAGTRVRGEVVVLVAGAAASPAAADPDEAARQVRALIERGEKPSAAARLVARQLGMSRREAYRLALGETGREEE